MGGRGGRLAVAALLVTGLVGGVASAAGAGLPAPGPAAAPAPVTAVPAVASAEPECRVPAPATAAGYQAMFDAKADEEWSGGDQATTVALPDGRVVWLFGDSVRGHRNPDGSRAEGSRMVHNALLVQTGGCLRAVPAPAEVIPSVSDDEWYWPQGATVVDGQLVVLAARVRRTGPGPADFTSTGIDAAVFSLTADLPVLQRVVPTPASRTPETGDQYGQALVQVGTWMYVYGSRKVPGAFGKTVTVARVRPEQLLTPHSWRYWTGRSWSARPSLAAPLATDWSTSFSVWSDRQGLRMLTKRDDVFGHDLVAGRAAGPTDAFSRTVVGQARSGERPGELRYTALAHPELPLADGGLLVSVCRNNLSLQQVWRDSDLYKPQFLAISTTLRHRP